ncbi:MAG: hypothetical protein IKA41_00900, partial [Bacteroidaceae bacterium]|nr:hypothetical protein [Bacteroidaceae bacterium]
MIYNYNNREVFIEESGSGTPVFLLHGWGCTHTIFAALQNILSKKYKVYNFDFPGFGASNEPTTIWGVEDYTRMVEQFAK